MIKLESVSKIFKGDVVALKNATAEIQRGEFVFLVGPSGSGKSTFIRLLNREEVADSGRIMVAGKDVGALSSWKVPYLRRNIGYIFQDYKLLPKKTVYGGSGAPRSTDGPLVPSASCRRNRSILCRRGTELGDDQVGGCLQDLQR